MTHEEYQDYLKTDRWHNIRRRVLHGKPKCAKCAFPYELNAHHKSYSRINTDDEIFDLIILCKACHSRHHFSERDSCGLYNKEAMISRLERQSDIANRKNDARALEVEQNIRRETDPDVDPGPQ